MNVIRWKDIEHLYSRGPFGSNAYLGIDFSAPGAFEAPFKRLEQNQRELEQKSSSDVLIIVLQPTENVYEKDILFELLRRRHYSFRSTGRRLSTVVIGPQGMGGQLYQWSISFVSMLDFVEASSETSSYGIVNPWAKHNPIDVDTFVPPAHAWSGNE